MVDLPQAGSDELPSEDSLTAELTRRRIRARLFGAHDDHGPLQVGPFELGERIGAGAMGTVYTAWDRRLARKVALEFLRLRERRGDELGLREAQALARLAHPNVVSVFDVGTHEGRVWLAMEFVVGSTMRAWVERQAPPDAEILVGEVSVATARIHRFAGDTSEASTHLGRAIDIAQDSGDHELAFAAWSGMVELEVDMKLDPEGARWAWARQRTAAEALGLLPLHRGALARAESNIERLSGSPRAAEARLREALEHYEHAGVTGQFRRVQLLDLLAATLALDGRGEESQRALAESERLRAALGYASDEGLRREGDHAFSAGLSELAAGELDAAREQLERALASYERNLGGRQRVAQVLVALATVEDAAARRVEARHYAELADAVCVAELSPTHPLRASTQSAIGTIALREGRVEQAVEAFTRALEIEATHQGEAGSDRALAHANLAEALVQAGRLDEARGHAEQALASLREALPENERDLAYPHKAMGMVLLAEGLVQRTFMACIESVDRYRAHSSFRTWLLESQLMFELVYWEQLTARQVGEVLGIPEGTARSRLRKARLELRGALDGLARSPAELESTSAGLEDWARGLRAAWGE